MANANEISVKAYLIKDGDNPEIRRFSVDQSVATSFLYLKEKLRATFPAKLSQSFEVYWKDSEGDEVIISTDEELTIALTDSKFEDLLKIYIRCKPGPETSGPRHEGIFCDECEKPISGFRYKCLGCHDYDLCSACEAKGLHREHFTIRIPNPLNMRHQFGHRLINKLTKAAKRAESRCPWSHRQEGGNQGWFYENLSEQFDNNCSTEEQPTRHWSHHSRHHPRRQSRCGGGDKTTKTDSSDYEKGCPTFTSASTGTGEGSRANSGPAITFDPVTILSTLADIGLDFTSLIFPPPANPTPSTQNQDANKEKSNDKDESSAAKMPKMNTPNSETYTAPASTSNNYVNKTAAPAPSNDVNMTAASAPPTPPPTTTQTPRRSSISEEWTFYNPNEPTVPVIDIDMDDKSTSSKSSKSQQKTQEKPAENTIEASTSNANTNNLYPSLAGLPKNKKVADALDQMIAMGFKNDDGWLTNLLNLHDGNIAKVLDLLQPAKKQ